MVHLPIVLGALGVSHVIRYINARYLLTYLLYFSSCTDHTKSITVCHCKGLHLVGRKGLGLRVSASFQKKFPTSYVR